MAQTDGSSQANRMDGKIKPFHPQATVTGSKSAKLNKLALARTPSTA